MYYKWNQGLWHYEMYPDCSKISFGNNTTFQERMLLEEEELYEVIREDTEEVDKERYDNLEVIEEQATKEQARKG